MPTPVLTTVTTAPLPKPLNVETGTFVYVPGVDADKLISPVKLLLKINPVAAEKFPPPAPGAKTGKGFFVS